MGTNLTPAALFPFSPPLTLPPLSGEDKAVASSLLSPFQGENQRGGFRLGGVILIPSSQRLPLKNLVVLLIVSS